MVEKKTDRTEVMNRIRPMLTPVVSLIFALIVSILFVMFGQKIGFVEAAQMLFKALWDGSFGDFDSFSNTMVITTPLILTGLAHALAFRTGLFNIGVEGQFMIGMISATIMGLVPGIPTLIHIPLILIAGMIGGAIWAAIPGYFKAARGTNEVVNTIMMNYIAFNLYNYLIRVPFAKPGTVSTELIQPSARLWRFVNPNNRLNIGIFIAIAVAVSIWYLMSKTTVGYELRAVGSNRYAAESGGISIKKNIILAMAISGLLAGLGGAIQLAGNEISAKQLGSFSNYGFNGIAVALLAKKNPIGVIFAALLFGALSNASIVLQIRGISKDIVFVIQAIVIIFVAADYVWVWLADRRKTKEAMKNV